MKYIVIVLALCLAAPAAARLDLHYAPEDNDEGMGRFDGKNRPAGPARSNLHSRKP